MEKEVQLLPEQVQKIKEEIAGIKEKRKELIDIYKKTNVGSLYERQGFSDVPDSSYATTITNLDYEEEKLEKLLQVAHIISEYNEERIAIGTRFAATCDYDGEMETSEYILTSIKEGVVSEAKRKDIEAIVITPNSPFGKAVMEKRIGDSFYYQMPDMTVVGFIEDIIPKEEVLGVQKTK